MKREVGVSIVAVLIVAAAIISVYYLGVGPTGRVVAGDYTNETSCVGAGYTWENTTGQNCTMETMSAEAIGWINSSGYTLTGQENATNFTVTGAWNITNQSEPISIDSGNWTLNSSSGLVLNSTVTEWSDVNFTYTYDAETCEEVVTGGQCVDLQEESCTPDWGCDAWSACSSSGTQTRSCTDANECGTDEGKPSEEQSCTPPPPEPVPEIVVEMTLQSPESYTAVPSDSRSLNLVASNAGNVAIFGCKLNAGGDYSSWASYSDEGQTVGVGESKTFGFSLSVPEDAADGNYVFPVSVLCNGGFARASELTVNVEKQKIDFNITSAQRTRQNRVSVDYIITELAGEAQDLQIYFSIKDSSGTEVANASQNRSVGANGQDDFRTNIPINESLNGTMTLSAAFNSQIYSSSVLEPIDLTTVTGGAIFGGIGTGSLIVVVIVALVLGAVFFVARRMRKGAAGKD